MCYDRYASYGLDDSRARTLAIGTVDSATLRSGLSITQSHYVLYSR